MELGKLIYEKRKQLGLSQEQLSEQLDVARQTVSKWETNETLPDLISLKKLATILNFSIDKALDIETQDEEDEEDEKLEWLIIAGFIIGNAIGMFLNNFILGYVGAMIGFGVHMIISTLRK